MTKAWLHIIGIGEDGWDGLRPDAQNQIRTANTIMGAKRHFALCNGNGKQAEHLLFPQAMQDVVPILKHHRERRVVVLTTGDPLWHSIGERIKASIPEDQIVYHPNVSAFQWAAARMRWSMQDVECLTVHGRSVETIIPFVYPNARLLIMTSNEHSARAIGALLTERGFGDSRMVILGRLGSAFETRKTITATACAKSTETIKETTSLHMLAIEMIAGVDALLINPAVGIDDSAFVTDGTFTKCPVRAITIGKLMPMRAALLWDVGCGSGTIAIEWVRAAANARAIGFDPRADRCAFAKQNAHALGAMGVQIRQERAPQGFANAPAPNAVFIGGGLSQSVFDAAWQALKPHGRLVINAVTTDNEAFLINLHHQYGGNLCKIRSEQLETLSSEGDGPVRTVWRAGLPTTQFVLHKSR